MQDYGVGIASAAFWAFIAAIILGGIWSDIRKRETKNETLRRVIESGQPIDPAILNKLVGGDKRLDISLKVAGIITLFVAPGLAVLGWFIGKIAPASMIPILGAASLIAFVGVGLLVAAKAAERSYQESSGTGDDRNIGL